MKINSSTQFLGLIGFPLKHSLSPLIHNYLFKKYNINAIYGCFPTKKLKEAVKGFLSVGFKGFNITIPYKEKVIPYLDKMDKEAKIIGAVNTVKIHKGKLFGYNTDGKGFLLSLKKFNLKVKDKNVLILGAGGAAKSISVYLAKEKAERIDFYDIIFSKAVKLAKRLKRFFSELKIYVFKDREKIVLKNYQILINATGVGLKKEEASPLTLEKASPDLVVYDLIYNPPLPSLLKEAKRRKLFTINGLWMLIYQALEAEKIWFGKDFYCEADILYKKLIKELKNAG